MSFITQPPKDYDIVIIPSRIRENFRWLFCQNCGHRIIGAYIDRISNADTGFFVTIETSYTIHEQCSSCHSHIRIVFATDFS